MSLECTESSLEGIKRAKKDPVLVQDDRVLQNLLKQEEKYLPRTTYFECVQRDVKPYMRKVVATWMLEVCEEQRCEDDVFPLSMNYLDRFLGMRAISRTQLQLLGASCMLIASKVKETIPLTAQKLVIYTDHSITHQELLDFELLVLFYLKWDVLSVTAIDFVDQILHRLDIGVENTRVARKHANTFIHLCYTDHKFSMYTPSMIAAGTVGAAVCGLPTEYNTIWSSRQRLIGRLYEITNVDIELLRECLEQVENILRNNLLHVTSSGDNESDMTSSSSNVTTNNNGSLNKYDVATGGYVRVTDDGERGDGNTPTDVCDVMF
ncbi:G1/S-specific cyclin-D2-like [Styela clava]|uniref:G1/S-specific cyclin-D2-like n=1 Tax=Styela clava TaxID=7725 RepID=UPI00193A32FF|nr:G1/S-specific cyclin-D2-like [Styela clava]